MEYRDGRGPQVQIHDAPRNRQNVLESEREILVAWYEENCSELCKELFDLPTGEDGTSETVRNATTIGDPSMEMGYDNYGLRHYLRHSGNFLSDSLRVGRAFGVFLVKGIKVSYDERCRSSILRALPLSTDTEILRFDFVNFPSVALYERFMVEVELAMVRYKERNDNLNRDVIGIVYELTFSQVQRFFPEQKRSYNEEVMTKTVFVEIMGRLEGAHGPCAGPLQKRTGRALGSEARVKSLVQPHFTQKLHFLISFDPELRFG
ncbi:hypothetical protein L6452_17658 [Arctium lappa]|uniref:Uncharacterized protein n=1 Tax=Arctium lappa TaxID=4217 RepID=A0ACB9C4B0_ARCLA|nr:hypothetical protein L6452_17658 [Arctium lappa]